jgi:Zn-dependent protease/predicted transcriptional regulator
MRNWSVFAGRVGDVELRIHVTFLFLLLFVVLGESNHGATAIARGFALAAMILGVVLLHELGHAIVAARNGFPIKGVVLLPVGGIAVVDPNIQTESARNLRRETQIAFSGPLVNLFLAGLFGLFLLGKGPAARLWVWPFVSVNDLGKSFFWINLALFAINLLPAFPLDGGRIFRAWLARKMEFRQATRRAVTFGHLFSALFMLAGALGQQWLMLVGFFIFMAAQMEERSVMFQSVVEDIHMEDIMLTEFSTLSPADTLEDALNKAVHCLQDDFPVVSGGDLVGVITRQIIVDRLRSEGNGYVQGAMTKAFEIASRTESLGSGFRKLTSRGLSLIPIVDQERLVGIVTLQNLMHSMGLWAESRRLRKQMEDQK